MNGNTIEIHGSEVPRIGMGCWAIGGPFWSGDTPLGMSQTDDVRSLAALEAAWESGVRVFDTAGVYGAGHSETLLGRHVARRDGAYIVSKVGHGFDAETKQIGPDVLDPAGIEAAVDASRARLRRDRIDLMLLHLNALPVADAEAIMDALEALRERGWIGAYGWSTDFPASAEAYAKRSGFAAVEHAMNLFFDAPSMCSTAEKHGFAQLVRSPLAMGLLTGKFRKGNRIGGADIRAGRVNWQDYFADGIPSSRHLATLDALRDWLTVGGRTLAQGALGWLLAASPRTLPVPGAKDAAQAEANARALELGPLPPEAMEGIEALVDRPPEGPPRER